jgi:glycosyltransferase involved in cell wall biosynthesis
MNRPNDKKIAIVHDDFIQNGGAEKLVECLLEIFPNAEIYTSIISDKWKAKLPNKKIHTSFINIIPFREKLYKAFAILYPVAFYLFNFNNYDLVISSSARFAHGIRTPSKTKHVAYINSPARMVWEPKTYFNKYALILLYPFLLILRQWDRHVSKNPDILIANSKTIQKRIKKYWNRNSEVIYPYHDLNKSHEIKTASGEYFILVSRLEKWKRIDIAVKACSELKQKLRIVGVGKYKESLENMADKNYVQFMGRLNDDDLIKNYLDSKALIMTQKEDFGITSVEAQSFGVPVVAYKSGGALETIIEKHTGIFFENQTIDSLKQALTDFAKIEIEPENCIIQADKFTKDEFIRRMVSTCQ